MHSIPEKEKEILAFWEKEHIFEKSLAKNKGKKSFVFYEGPPTANGKPGIHHVLARAYKDVVLRFKTMQGFYVPRKAGWDTHGLPVELEVEKELGITSKKGIEEYGIENFVEKAKESVWKYKELWNELTKRMGFWLDLEHPYITYETDYIESLWFIIKTFWEKGLLEEDFKVVPWCYRCGTPLSSHELAQGYKKVTDTAVYVKFNLKSQISNLKITNQSSKIFVLSWTTTPWTLPGNVALAVGEDIDYVVVEIAKGEITHNCIMEEFSEGIYVIARKRYKDVFYNEPSEGNIIKELKGKDLIGLEYEPLFKVPELKSEKSYKIYSADFVNTEEGTGVVHTAVMYGEDDYQLGEKVGLPKFHTVTEEGKFIDSLGEGLAGLPVKAKETEEKIANYLQKKGLLFAKEDYEHDYPFCWRCKNPLLYYATKSWFVKVTKVKKELLKNNETINWIPDHLKKGRFGNFLEEVKDWAFSRKRYWGTPLPIWKCESCKKVNVIGSLEELKGAGGLIPHNKEGEVDLHRPYIDAISLKCDTCGHAMKRIEEVADVWFDSGAMPFAQTHWPFAFLTNDQRPTTNDCRKLETLAFPADYICEAIDQTRGWFYTLLAVSTLLGFDAPYKNVISLGHLLDEKGRKMSKSLGNIIDPFQAADTYGMDPIRWYFFVVNPPGLYKRFDPKEIKAHTQLFLLTLFNVAQFWKLHNATTSYKLQATSYKLLDKWITSRLHGTIKIVTDFLSDYEITAATREIERFVDDLSNWYVRRSRERFQNEEGDIVSGILYNVLLEISKLIAPFVPFSAEYIYQELTGDKGESVHLKDWPKSKKLYIDVNLEIQMRFIREISADALAKRAEAGVKVRQPLPKLKVKSQKLKVKSSELLNLIKDEVNVKEVVFDDTINDEVELDTRLTPEFLEEGFARELVRQVQDLRKQAGLTPQDKITLYIDPELKEFGKKWGSYITQKTNTRATTYNLQPTTYKKELNFGEKKVIIGIDAEKLSRA